MKSSGPQHSTVSGGSSPNSSSRCTRGLPWRCPAGATSKVSIQGNANRQCSRSRDSTWEPACRAPYSTLRRAAPGWLIAPSITPANGANPQPPATTRTRRAPSSDGQPLPKGPRYPKYGVLSPIEQGCGKASRPTNQGIEMPPLVRRTDIGKGCLTQAGHGEHEKLPSPGGQIAGLGQVDAKAEVSGIFAVFVLSDYMQASWRQVDHGRATLCMTP
ncbi:hypothetical protein C4K04_3438 [Pseudomonas chlororaphis]|uniref:Uncharacterized protein n=1 Tax=Pseudomonas chlororaphis TaxID=587753 RepID=A0A3G7TPX8_9PSED|nr:hypothetical protein C4K04_3438 [Pseudomonas chlororaphis]